MKFVPLIGLILLFALTYGTRTGDVSAESFNTLSAKEKFLTILSEIGNSFIFSDVIEVLITIVALITLWTGYKYWLSQLRYVRRNSKLLEKLVVVVMVLIFLTRHVKTSSIIGSYVDWALFLLFLYLVIVGSWFLAKTIDGIDLSSDLYCWGLRLIGGVVIIFGVMLLLSSALVLTLSSIDLVFNNIYWILSVCVILLGMFMEYRSFRRHPAIHVW